MTQQSDHIVPRYEFRIFEKDLKDYFEQMKKIGGISEDQIQIRYSEETYFLVSNLTELNCKVRNVILDIKKLVGTRKDLEKWNPVYKHAFPLPEKELEEKIFPLLNLHGVQQARESYSFDEWKNLFSTINNCHVVPVVKKRFGLNIQDTICEFAEVRISGSELQSIACESESDRKVLEMMQLLKIIKFKNTSYPQAILQVLHQENII